MRVVCDLFEVQAPQSSLYWEFRPFFPLTLFTVLLIMQYTSFLIPSGMRGKTSADDFVSSSNSFVEGKPFLKG